MADSDVTRKLHIYRALFRLNRGFAILYHNLDWLTANRVSADPRHQPSNAPEWYETHLEEIQASINRRLTETLNGMEHGDVKRLGRIVEMMPEIREKYYPSDKPEQKAARNKKHRK
jgi:hypothetical protein